MTTKNDQHDHMEDNKTDKDLQFEFNLQRALLEETPSPDVDAAFSAFKKRNAPPGKHIKSLSIAAACLLAAACLIGFIFFTDMSKKETIHHTTQLARLGNVVYEAHPERQFISVSFGDKTIDISPSTNQQSEGITLTDNNEIQVFNVPKDNHNEATLSVPQGLTAKIMLDDGTIIWMNADSKITFPRHFYDKGPREVKLSGEACFEVTHDENRPFTVSCNGFKTTVLGTKFNIHSYDNEAPKITLISGKISVDNEHQVALLNPEQTLTINNEHEMDITQADLDVVTSWMTGNFYFDGQTLQEILTEVGRWYNVNIVFTNSKHLTEKLHFNTERNKPIQNIVKQLHMICNAKFQLTDKALIVD